nr:cytochrome c oxidase subunit 3 [Microheliella maris]
MTQIQSRTILPRHPFHIIDPSPWPLVTSTSAFTTLVGAVMYFHMYEGGSFVLTCGLIALVSSMFYWWRDVIRESTFEGRHTSKVQQGLRYGMILFITSEVMFFVAFFWAFFHSSLAPAIQIGAIWPPKGIEVLNAFEVPLLNTFILLLSGATITWAHHAILAGKREESIYGLIATVTLALLFTTLQAVEYNEAAFNISDSVYGSTFYMATGFHGFHVIVGTLFITVCLYRQMKYHFTKQHHFGFEAAAWYWHFVDVVWLFLFVAIYWWGGA